ncbi:MAG: ATP-binding cassette domain-containing protein [Planctomycetota bacterium]|nr:MAG: ATP-binding cassette domain-containing protein [Planctomycetota bacterium]
MNLDHLPLISIDQVWTRYKSAGPWVLQNCSLQLFPGERILIQGPNGSGKSTLLKVISGLISPQRGECQHCGHRSCSCAYLAQEHQIDWSLPVTVEEFVWCGRHSRLRWGLPARRADRQAVAQALREVELYDLRRQPMRALSGGQRQRLLIARTLAQGARILLLDEPLSGLDSSTRSQLAHILERICTEHQLTLVMSTHEREGFDLRFDRQVFMQDGQVCRSDGAALVGAAE